ncbi:hypothetical protein P0082_10125 [Candidatus Haliotispira prima]|uniref:Lipoprotein n=1 Tax=Candidatus Haliotispira prima TaxID=3034016 RepID=A0ABY8MGZ9_9SPIO|nr:hypothetical protein P0082_10125 [Candidatus Haliotispira prima]
MRKYLLILFSLTLALFVSACSSVTISWTPEGSETTTIGLRTESGADVHVAIRNVDGQFQANPWTFYVPPKSKGRRPKILGEGKDANVVEIEVGTDYELELGFFTPRGLLQKAGADWNEGKPKITLKALEAGKTYTFLVKKRGQIALGSPVPAPGELNVATLILKGGKGLLDMKVMQQWRVYVAGDAEKLVQNLTGKPYLVEEEEPKNGLF